MKTGNFNIIPEGTKEIATAAFENNKNLTSVVIPEGVRKIGVDAFAGCEKLREVKIASTVRIIEAEAFKNCNSLVSVTIPDGVEIIHQGTFSFCTSLETVVLAESVRCLDNFSFNQCKNLNNIVTKNNKLVIGDNTFGYKVEMFPAGLISKCENIFKHMTDSAFKKYILNRRVWRSLTDEASSKIFLAKHAGKFLNYYGACMTDSQIMHLGEFIIDKLKETNAKKSDYNAAVAYMATFNEVVDTERLKEIYGYIENCQNAESLIERIKKNKDLQRKIENKGSQRKTHLTETDEIAKKIIDMQGLNVVNIKCELRCKYGITADELPSIYDKNGKKLKSYVFAYLLVTHGRDDYTDCDIYEKPGLRPEAAKVLKMIDDEKFQEALIKLADDYLLLPGKPIYNEKIYCLFFPLCRYANEENIIYMIDFYDERKREPSMLPMASWYSGTRAAWLFAEETKTLTHYAKIRKMSAKELRALSYLETDGDLETNKEAFKKCQKEELFRKYLGGGHWKEKEWQELYREVNMLRELVEPLVWVQGDNTFAIDGERIVDCNGNEYSFNKARIRLAHPMEMKKDEVEKWQNYLKERKLEPYFNQLGEKVYTAEEIKPDRYKGIKISISELCGREEHGIMFTENMYSFGSASVKIKEYEDEKSIVIESFRFEKFTRKLNHIIGQLDKIVNKSML